MKRTFVDDYLSELNLKRTDYPLSDDGKKFKTAEQWLDVSSWDAQISTPIVLYMILRTYKDNSDDAIVKQDEEKRQLNEVLAGLKDWIIFETDTSYNPYDPEEFKKHHAILKKTMKTLGEVLPALWW